MKFWRRSMTVGFLGLAAIVLNKEALAQGANVELATASEKQSATNDYKAGMKAFEEKKPDLALELFRKSYGTVASPNSGLMIARMLIELGRSSEAYQELVQVTELANALARSNPKYKTTADAAAKELEELKPKIARVNVSVPVSVAVNDVSLPPAEWSKPIALAPGATTLRLRVGEQTSEQRLTLAAGAEQSVSLSLPQAPAPAPVAAAPSAEPARGGNTLGYVALGVGGAGMVASAVFLLLNQGKLNDIKSSCVGTECAGIADDVDASRTGETLALVGLGVGLVGVGMGAYLILSSSDGPPKRAAGRTTLHVGLDSVRVATEF